METKILSDHHLACANIFEILLKWCLKTKQKRKQKQPNKKTQTKHKTPNKQKNPLVVTLRSTPSLAVTKLRALCAGFYKANP